MAVPKFDVGQKVRVKRINYADPIGWKSKIAVGAVGVVEAHDTQDCGASQHDPLNIVRFSRRRKDGFWNEELEELT